MTSAPDTFDDAQIRRAEPANADAIALAHLDSIRSVGRQFYPPAVVEAWSAGISPELYVNAVIGGEAFFVATGAIDAHLVAVVARLRRRRPHQIQLPSSSRRVAGGRQRA